MVVSKEKEQVAKSPGLGELLDHYIILLPLKFLCMSIDYFLNKRFVFRAPPHIHTHRPNIKLKKGGTLLATILLWFCLSPEF